MNYTIILRHAERTHIKNINETETADLTLKGIFNSIKMGLFIKNKYKGIDIIKTSYIMRCYNTAKYLKISYSPFRDIKIERAKNNGELVSSGYIKNEHFMDWVTYHFHKKMEWKYFQMYYEDMIKNKWANYDSIEEFTKAFFKENLTDKNTLIITHDTTVIPILIGLKKFGTKELFPKPLSGLIIHHEKGEIKKLEWIEQSKIETI